jgi:predicted GNAT superfamily acetyltransferase
MTDYEIRPLEGMDELRVCVEIQEETWGVGFSERVPPAILKVSQILGGLAAGAFAPDGTLVGFVFGMTGPKDGELVHWSDMVAVRRKIRDAGLGTRLKAYQRRVLLDRGIKKCHWTFDPLQARNAFLNFSKLGALVREYVPNMYGDTGSPLHRGIGTDRFIALWLLSSERVERRMTGVERGPGPHELSNAPFALAEESSTDEVPSPGTAVLGLITDRIRVVIPSDISGIMSRSRELAVAWREATRKALTHYLERGYEVRELLRGTRTGEYVLWRR